MDPVEQDLQELIDQFKDHPDREAVYVPNWGKDKIQLRPHLLARGRARLWEMLETFVRREAVCSKVNGDFNWKCIMEAPMSIQGFVGVVDRMNQVIRWDTKEVPHRKGS